MSEINREEVGWILSRVWIDALEEAARDFHGNWPMMFTSRAYEHATDAWLKVMANEYDITTRPATTIMEGVESYIDVGLRGGLFDNPTDFSLQEVGPNKVEISVYNCPYKKSCMDLLDAGFGVSDLTCARIGCFRAAVKTIVNVECSHEVTQFSPDVCEGYVERI